MDIVTLLILSFLWSWFITSFATSLGYHRYFTHRQFKAPVWFEYFVLLLAPFSGASSIISWAGVHRLHHAQADTENDPHSPRYVSIVKIFLGRYKIKTIPVKYVIDLMKNPRAVWFHRYGKYVRWSVSIAILILFSFKVFLLFVVVPYLYGYIVYGLVNVLCHTEDGIKNLWFVSLLTGGEGWHNVHHHDSKQHRLNKYDLLGWVTEKVFDTDK